MLLLKKKLGEKPDVKVEIRYSKEAIEKVVSNSLIPFMQEWEKKLSAFEPLFHSRKVLFSFPPSGRDGNAFDEKFFEDVKDLIQKRGVSTVKNSEILLRGSFHGLRNINSDADMNGGEIKIKFYENAYEIKILSEKKGINKLYHQELTENEINTIASNLGNWFHNNVEEFIENNKK